VLTSFPSSSFSSFSSLLLAVALKSLWNGKCKIVLAEPLAVNDASISFSTKTHHTTNKPGATSVADGLKTCLGPKTFPIVRDLVDDVMCVDEVSIMKATKTVWSRMKVLIEPSAGVGVAVLLSDEFRSKYPPHLFPRVGVILCGGNCDIDKVINAMGEMGV